MATTINNLELYEFLKEEVECGIQYKYETKSIECWVWLDFCQLKEFVDLVGNNYFYEGGVECNLQETRIAIDLNDIIEYQGDDIFSYKSIFQERDYEEAIKLYDLYGSK